MQVGTTRINPLKCEARINAINILVFNSYLTESILYFHYKDQSIPAVYGDNRRVAKFKAVDI